MEIQSPSLGVNQSFGRINAQTSGSVHFSWPVGHIYQVAAWSAPTPSNGGFCQFSTSHVLGYGSLENKLGGYTRTMQNGWQRLLNGRQRPKSLYIPSLFSGLSRRKIVIRQKADQGVVLGLSLGFLSPWSVDQN